MKWIQKYLSEEEIRNIGHAITAAEMKTRGEIVPVIVKSSTPARHVPLVLALIILVGLLFVDHEAVDFLHIYPYQFLWILIFLLALAVGHLLAQVPAVKRLLLSDKDEKESVYRRAQLEFYLNQVHRTQEGVGILIFVSLLEHRAVILGDRLISEKVQQGDWEQILTELLAGIREKRWEKAMTNAIGQAADLLATHFPMRENETNELSNELVIKD